MSVALIAGMRTHRSKTIRFYASHHFAAGDFKQPLDQKLHFDISCPSGPDRPLSIWKFQVICWSEMEAKKWRIHDLPRKA